MATLLEERAGFAKQRSADVGFGSSERANKKKPKLPILYQHDFSGLIPGDVALAVEAALAASELEHEEISTVVSSRTGDTDEVPFIRHQTDSGIEIPFGSYRVEDIGDIQMVIDPYKEVPTMRLIGKLHKKDQRSAWKDLLKAIRAQAEKDSIFKGRAILVEDKTDLLVPKPMILTREIELAFNQAVEDELETVLFWPLLNREECHKHGIRTRRGVILEGHYGAGKSLLLYKAAQLAHKAGWGVLHITANMIATAIELSKLLEPVVMVVEDIDATTHGDRDRLNFLLNRLSSVSTKTEGDYALLLSTNFIDRIDPALLRPERVDAIVKVDLPDESTVRRLFNVFGGNSIAYETPTFQAAEKELAGTTPAIISEVMQRTKIDALRNKTTINEDRLLFHAKRMEKQRKLAMPEFRSATTGDQLVEALHKTIDGRF